MRTDIAIVGGGCGALWLHYWAIEAGLQSCLLSSVAGLGGFATSNGQNRLHSGAMYVLAGQTGLPCEAMIRECAESRRLMKEVLGSRFDQLVAGSRGLYLFHSEAETSEAETRLSSYPQLMWRRLNRREDDDTLNKLASVFAAHRWAIETEEPAFDQALSLTAIAELCGRRRGANQHIAFGHPSEVSLTSFSGGWEVSVGGVPAVRATRVVFALGAYNQAMEARLRGLMSADQAHRAEIDRTLIAVWRPQLFDIPVAIQRPRIDDGSVAGHITLLPQGGSTTITTGMRMATRSVLDPADFSVWTQTLRGLGELLRSEIQPNLYEKLPPLEIRVCQKTNNIAKEGTSHPYSQFGKRHYNWHSPPENPDIFFYSPGKWTLAARGGQQFISTVALDIHLKQLDQQNLQLVDQVSSTALNLSSPSKWPSFDVRDIGDA